MIKLLLVAGMVYQMKQVLAVKQDCFIALAMMVINGDQ